MQRKCSRCGQPIKKVGRLVKKTWFGYRAPLCKKCRDELKKKEKRRFNITGFLKRWKK